MFKRLQSHNTRNAYVVVPNRLHITDSVLAFIANEIREWQGVETGGALVGYVESGRIVATHASGPGPRGIRRPNSVLIDGSFTTEFAFRLQSTSCGQLYYLGDWHTHLKSSLSLSGDDYKAARILLNAGVCLVPFLISVIFSSDVASASGYLFDGLSEPRRMIVELGGSPSWRAANNYH